MIVDGSVQNVLGKKSCSELKLVKRVDAIKRCITDDYADVFHGLPRAPSTGLPRGLEIDYM